MTIELTLEASPNTLLPVPAPGAAPIPAAEANGFVPVPAPNGLGGVKGSEDANGLEEAKGLLLELLPADARAPTAADAVVDAGCGVGEGER